MGYDRNDRGGSERYDGRDSRPQDYRGSNYSGPRDQRYGGSDDRGFFDRAGDEVRSWFGDEEAERRRRMDERFDGRSGGDRQDGGRYAPYSSGGYTSPDRYSSWDRSNQSNDNRGSRERGQVSGYGYGGDHDQRNDPYRGGFGGQARHDEHGYHGWRDRQISEFDRDYDEYRRENQSRFASEFSAWRQNRQGQRQSLQTAKEHMEVLGSDGSHVGTVDHIRGDRILLTKTDRDAGGHHHSIPSSWIKTVDDKVHLSKTADEAKQAWKDEEQNQGLFGGDRNAGGRDDRGPTNLDRSFSGTY